MDLFPKPSLAGPVVRSVQTADGKRSRGGSGLQWVDEISFKGYQPSDGRTGCPGRRSPGGGKGRKWSFCLWTDADEWCEPVKKDQGSSSFRLLWGFLSCSIRTDLWPSGSSQKQGNRSGEKGLCKWSAHQGEKSGRKMQGYLWKPVTGSSNRGDQKYQNCDPGSFRYGKAFWRSLHRSKKRAECAGF